MLQILHLEDSEKDAAIIMAHLRRAALDVSVKRVETEAAYQAALNELCYDLILADFHLPLFSGEKALELAQKTCPETPFIFLSGAIGEEEAVETLKRGATDFVLKDRLARLVPCIQRAINEANDRKAVATSRRELQIITDTMGAALTSCNAEMRYVWVNGAFSSLIGKPVQEICGKHIVEVLGNDDFQKIRPHIDRVLSGERVEHEVEFNQPSTGSFWIHCIYTPSRLVDGKVDGWVASIVDITSLKRTEQLLKEADKRKDEFLAMLSHELRNPLVPIRNGVHLLRTIKQDNPKWDELREMLERQVGHMARIVDDLLDVSRISCGKIILHKEDTDLCQLLREVAIDYEHNAAESNVTLTVDCPKSAAFVHADRTRLVQAIGNLIQNAVKFSKPAGLISIQLHHSDSTAILTVSDNGIGLEPELIPKLFQPFSQGPQTPDRTQGGLGLGLAMAKGIIDLHGGSITVRSDGTDRGTTFEIKLPLKKSAQSDKKQSESHLSVASLKILVVEDNNDAAETVRMLLELNGHEVKTAQDGPKALEIVSNWPPQLVLCDIGLPGMDGYSVCTALRRLEALKESYFVAMTGYGQSEDIERAAQVGFDVHLTKPVDPNKLDELIVNFSKV